jgi:hypothetical protein
LCVNVEQYDQVFMLHDMSEYYEALSDHLTKLFAELAKFASSMCVWGGGALILVGFPQSQSILGFTDYI